MKMVEKILEIKAGGGYKKRWGRVGAVGKKCWGGGVVLRLGFMGLFGQEVPTSEKD